MFELFGAKCATEAHTNWPHVTYKGHNLFESYIAHMEHLQPEEGDRFDSYGISDSQECYLGYDPERDWFVSGFDCWLNGESESDELCKNIVVWKLTDSGECRVINVLSGSRMIYHNDMETIKDIRKVMPKLVDIRLD